MTDRSAPNNQHRSCFYSSIRARSLTVDLGQRASDKANLYLAWYPWADTMPAPALTDQALIVRIQCEEFHRDEGRHPNPPAAGGLQPILPERRLLVQEVLELRLRLSVLGFQFDVVLLSGAESHAELRH